MALFCSGIGTLLYIFATKGKIPSFIGSSFAFIGAIILVKDKYSTPVMLSGVIAAGLVYIIVAGIIKLMGVKWIDKALPPVVVGSIVALIGLSLAGTAVEMAGFSLASPVEKRDVYKRQVNSSEYYFGALEFYRSGLVREFEEKNDIVINALSDDRNYKYMKEVK